MAYKHLNQNGYINIGCYKIVKPPVQRDETIAVIGAGWAGIIAARQLQSFGYTVILLEVCY